MYLVCIEFVNEFFKQNLNELQNFLCILPPLHLFLRGHRATIFLFNPVALGLVAGVGGCTAPLFSGPLPPYLFVISSEDRFPSSGIFMVSRNDPAPGPVDWRSLPLAGRLPFSAAFIFAPGTSSKSGRRSSGSEPASPLCPGELNHLKRV